MRRMRKSKLSYIAQEPGYVKAGRWISLGPLYYVILHNGKLTGKSFRTAKKS